MIVAGQYAELPTGIRLHYATAGRRGAPLVLFLHGFPEYWGAWEDVLPGFADDYFAVAPDLRGFNLSSQPADVAAYKAKLLCEDLRGLIDHLGYDAAYVVAHDWGGAIGWQLAIASPDRVRKLAILNSPHPIPFARDLVNSPAQQQASAYMNWLRAPDAEAKLSANDFAMMVSFLSKMARPDRAWLTPERIARYKAVWARGLTGGLNYYRVSPLHPPTPTDPGPTALSLKPADFTVRVPTLVLWGMADIALLPSLLDGLDTVVPDLTIERLPLATHWLVHEEPQWIIERLRAFLPAN